jgi:hypothetical protein
MDNKTEVYLRCCNNKCSNYNNFKVAHGVQLKKCGNCKGVRYCSKKCQQEHWSDHQEQCKAIKTAISDSSLVSHNQSQSNKAMKKIPKKVFLFAYTRIPDSDRKNKLIEYNVNAIGGESIIIREKQSYPGWGYTTKFCNVKNMKPCKRIVLYAKKTHHKPVFTISTFCLCDNIDKGCRTGQHIISHYSKQ